LVLYLILTGQLKRLLSRLRGGGVGPFKFDLSAEGARATRDTVQASFAEMRHELRDEFDRLAKKRRLRRKLEKVMASTEVRSRLHGPRGGPAPRYRCTIHVPDPLLRDYLYQLLDYVPTGGGRGRSFSCRTGLIGVVWRSEKNAEWAKAVTNDMLIRYWGMTIEEARESQAKGRRSFICVRMLDPTNQSLVGLLYLDSMDEGTFGQSFRSREALMHVLEERCQKTGLTACLASAVRTMLERSPEIDLRLRG